MGGSSSSRHISVEAMDAEGIVFVKGIRLTDRVVDRMKETPPVQDPQSKSSTYAPVTQPVSPQSETLTPTEPLALKLPHPPSYASALVPPSLLQESTSPLVPKSVPASVPSVQKHVVASTATNSVPPAQPAEPLPIPTSPLTVTEPVAMPLLAETVPVVLSPPAEAVDISPPPPTITDTVTSPLPTELKVTPVESPTMPLTNDVLTAPPVKAIHLPSTVETTDIPVESSFPSSSTMTPDATSPVEQEKLPTTPISKLVLPLLFDTKLSIPIESVEISTEMPPAHVKSSDLSNNLEELLSPPPSSALPLPCEDFSVGQIMCPPTEDTPASRPVVEPANAPVLHALTETLGPLLSPQIVVKEEDLSKQTREELEKLLHEEKKMAELKIQQQLEQEKAKAKAEAQAKAQQQIQAEVEKILQKKQLALQQTLKDAIIQERKSIQDEQLLCQYYWMKRKKQIQKLEKKERDLARQDLMYKEQLAKLEEKTAKFTRVTAESFRKGLEETHKRFKKYQIKPVCSELQSEILKCYLQNTGKSLKCSRVALQYVKCVNNAKQNKKLSTGG